MQNIEEIRNPTQILKLRSAKVTTTVIKKILQEEEKTNIKKRNFLQKLKQILHHSNLLTLIRAKTKQNQPTTRSFYTFHSFI